MPKRDDYLLLADMIECCKNIFEYTAQMNFEDYLSSKITKDAVVRNFEILGEAAKAMSEEIMSNHPEVEWKKLGDFRNVLIHQYFGVNHELVWQIKEDFLPDTLDFLEQLLNEVKRS